MKNEKAIKKSTRIKGNVRKFKPEFIAMLDKLKSEYHNKKIMLDCNESLTLINAYIGKNSKVIPAVRFGISRYLRAKGYKQSTSYSDINRVRIGNDENGNVVFKIDFASDE